MLEFVRKQLCSKASFLLRTQFLCELMEDRDEYRDDKMTYSSISKPEIRKICDVGGSVSLSDSLAHMQHGLVTLVSGRVDW
jgi:hypothetical protein